MNIAEAKKKVKEQVKKNPKFEGVSDSEFDKLFQEALRELRIKRVRETLDDLI